MFIQFYCVQTTQSTDCKKQPLPTVKLPVLINQKTKGGQNKNYKNYKHTPRPGCQPNPDIFLYKKLTSTLEGATLTLKRDFTHKIFFKQSP